MFIYIREDTDECKNLLGELSSAVSGFTKCAVEYARPIGVCDNCIESYLMVLDVYDNLTKVIYNIFFIIKYTKVFIFQTIFNGSICIDRYRSLDRLEVVDSIKNNAIHLWNKANCDGM